MLAKHNKMEKKPKIMLTNSPKNSPSNFLYINEMNAIIAGYICYRPIDTGDFFYKFQKKLSGSAPNQDFSFRLTILSNQLTKNMKY